MTWLVDGGPMMVPIIALGVVGVLLAGVWTLLQGLLLRVPALAWVVVPVGVVCVGMAGTSLGLTQTLEAVEYASVEMKQTLLAAGIAVSLITTATGWLTAGVLLLASAGMLALATVVRPGPGATWTPLHALAPLAVGLVGVVFSAWVWTAGPVVVAGGLAVAVACLRWPGNREPSGDAHRVATARVTVGGMATLGVLAIFQFTRLYMGIEGFEAVSRASAETKSVMLQGLGEAMALDARPGALAAGLLLVGTAAAAAPVRRWLLDPRSTLGAAAVALLALLPVASGLWLGSAMDRIDTRSPWDIHADALREAGVRLPSTVARDLPDLAVTVVAGSDDLAVDGVSVGWGGERRDGLHWPLLLLLDEKAELAIDLGALAGGDAEFRGELNLEADRDLPWSRVALVLDAAAGARFARVNVHGIGDGRTRAFSVDLAGEPHPEAGSRYAPPPPEPSDRVEIPDRFVDLILVDPSVEEEGEDVFIRGDPPWSEVVALLDAAREGSGSAKLVLHTGPAPDPVE